MIKDIISTLKKKFGYFLVKLKKVVYAKTKNVNAVNIRN